MNGDGFVRRSGMSRAAGWTGPAGGNVDGWSAGQPADGSAGKRRPASGRGETEEVDCCAIRVLRGQGLVEEEGVGEVGGRVADSCRPKKKGG